MRYLKTFESYYNDDFTKELADAIIDEIRVEKEEKGYFSSDDYWNLVNKRGLDKSMAEDIYHLIVSEEGFTDEDDSDLDDSDVEGIYLKKDEEN